MSSSGDGTRDARAMTELRWTGYFTSDGVPGQRAARGSGQHAEHGVNLGLPLSLPQPYLPAMSSLSSRWPPTAANDNRPSGTVVGRLAFWWPVLAVWTLPPIIASIAIGAAVLWIR